MADNLARSLISTGAVRLLSVTTTDVAREAARRHGAVAGAAVALARGATAGLLLATMTKGKERVTLQLVGDGPLGGVTVDANDAGEVRAYLKNTSVLVTGGAARRVKLASALGRHGVVNVIRDLGLRELYRGQASLLTGEIDEDVENYLRSSEQIESALGCEAVLSDSLELVSSGGLLVQAMPGGEGTPFVREAQHRFRTGALYEALARDPRAAQDPAQLASAVLGDIARDLDLLDIRPVRFSCPCSKERVLASLAAVSEDELLAMIREDRHAEVVCNFCNEEFALSGDELSAILQEKRRGPYAVS
ncbi:MAG: Hsp33 family molecular chaperone HslO [Deltaproteobacteria bacterium]|nr:Hsp33 family molecular chaperone HslO [Deltaproteobacteria bacterium]